MRIQTGTKNYHIESDTGYHQIETSSLGRNPHMTFENQDQLTQ